MEVMARIQQALVGKDKEFGVRDVKYEVSTYACKYRCLLIKEDEETKNERTEARGDEMGRLGVGLTRKEATMKNLNKRELYLHMQFVDEDHITLTLIQTKKLPKMHISRVEHAELCKYLAKLGKSSIGISYSLFPLKPISKVKSRVIGCTYKLHCHFLTSLTLPSSNRNLLEKYKTFEAFPPYLDDLLSDKLTLIDNAIRGIELFLEQPCDDDFFSPEVVAEFAA
ncbi:unnamed protein product [Moneuplotes crassus]|uniref:Uncharacterized protein n=1 Tax=Euplotes crassus TaxID=5936 RepID=A0AAD1UF89_EUPCR|nr:unnamed protein product [Moneuplotes crassus]